MNIHVGLRLPMPKDPLLVVVLEAANKKATVSEVTDYVRAGSSPTGPALNRFSKWIPQKANSSGYT